MDGCPAASPTDAVREKAYDQDDEHSANWIECSDYSDCAWFESKDVDGVLSSSGADNTDPITNQDA